ncbi:MAG: lysyl-tRNA synthetase class 2 [Candidatus Nanohaloarchaea archaeon]|jgi:lysyl-tRNA synthetase class 2
MSSERDERMENLRERRENGEAFSYEFERSHTIDELQEFDEGEEQLPDREFSTAGRVMEIRDFGQLVFLDLRDERSEIQVIVREDDEVLEKLDETYRGDIIGVTGTLTYTEREEFSLEASNVEILTTAVRPIPSEHFGVEDNELRYRDRPLHLTMDMEARDRFRQRSRIISELRTFLERDDFMEVETPTIQPVYGGANAEPFETHVNDRDMEAYLRISPELYLKRLIVGGYERIFEVATNFRNESIDTTHNPEFRMMELYQAYADYEDMMEITENLIEHIAQEVLGETTINYQGQELDLSAPWRRMTMHEAIREYGGFDVESMNDERLREVMEEVGAELDSEFERGLAIAEIFEEVAEEQLVQPTHITDYPQETTPLCMDHRSQEDLIERFESFVAGMELANAYTELRDPIQQREHFKREQRRQEEGDEEAHPLDMDFIEALELGMPPTGGLGIGIDRLVMILTDSSSIRDVLFFPMMSD